MAFVEFRHVDKIYQMGEVRIEALRDVSFSIERGEICVIVGASGAGKTTLLNILGGMDSLSAGTVTLDGDAVSAYGGRRLTEYRRFDVGFVFQFYNLIPNLTALENVEIAARMGRDPLDPMRVLTDMGLADRAQNFPAQLSGGEPEAPALRRAHRRAGLCDGQADPAAPAGHRPQPRHDGRDHHAQQRPHRHGGPGGVAAQRPGGRGPDEPLPAAGLRDRVVSPWAS